MHFVQCSVTYTDSLDSFRSLRRTSFLVGTREGELQSSGPYFGIWLRSLKSGFCQGLSYLTFLVFSC